MNSNVKTFASGELLRLANQLPEGETVLVDRKTPEPWSVFGADFAVHYRRYGLPLAAF
jgi:hypothetical protein